ncbi:glycosyltransferase family protein [Anaerocolumna xylanovorans]|uniref:Spore maturation protein CgeB n=1 Tax=Anaerocolumna xylanovorans DSM 12503 TaxID=1121345 RepID=A0A1M7Y819_9FIRM|nr:glycosyltransferase [Anaerocolumna xylanovorans]SHO48760.1 spore maturation protein CgeB [Anaerocolumna xylanovorans DSM 12503]
MKILFLEWPCYGAENWIRELENQGYEVTHMKVPHMLDEDDMVFQNRLVERIKDKGYELLCTFNFLPMLSIIARNTNIRYLSWVYDSPLLTMYSVEVGSPNNYIFLFDRRQYEEFRDKGIQTVHYLPLAGVTGIEKDSTGYSSEVTFVGALYQTYNLFDEIKYLPDRLKGYLEGIMEAQRRVYGYYMLPELLSEELLGEILKYIKMDLGDQYWASYRDIFASQFLAKKTANLERESMLRYLAQYFRIYLYSNERLEVPNIINCGTVPYGAEMYKVFQRSKININSTLRCIQTGINLRTMDILSAGGFCLTNYQEELSSHFVIGKELEVYESELDLLEKTAYYLEHEEEREEIARNGKKRIEESHTYPMRVKEMMDIVCRGFAKSN